LRTGLHQAIEELAQRIKCLRLLHDPAVANIGAANPALDYVIEALVYYIATNPQGSHERRGRSSQIVSGPATARQGQ